MTIPRRRRHRRFGIPHGMPGPPFDKGTQRPLLPNVSEAGCGQAPRHRAPISARSVSRRKGDRAASARRERPQPHARACRHGQTLGSDTFTLHDVEQHAGSDDPAMRQPDEPVANSYGADEALSGRARSTCPAPPSPKRWMVPSQGRWCHRKGDGAIARAMVPSQGRWCHRKGDGAIARAMVPSQGRWCHRQTDGGARRDRTDDLMLAKHALSRLSYGPTGRTRRPARARLVGLGRLELPTSRLSSARSNQLSYKPEPARPRWARRLVR